MITTKLFGMLCILLLSGCGTIQALSEIESHTRNIELRLNPENSMLEWQSLPDFMGEIALDKITPCKQARFFVGAGFLNNDLEEIKGQFLDLNPSPWYPKRSKEKANDLLTTCDILIFEQHADSNKAVSFNFVNNKFESVYTFQMSQRDSIPIQEWPYLSLAVLVDIPVVIITTPLVVVGYPLFLMKEYFDTKAPDEKTKKNNEAKN